MEILINGEYLKASEYKSVYELRFDNLTTKQKLYLEEWMSETAGQNGKGYSSEKYKKEIYFFDDRKCGQFLGVFPNGVGDASFSYTLSYDSKKIIHELEIEDIKKIKHQ